MNKRFSTYMHILERENIDGLKKSIKNDFVYHLREYGEQQQSFRQQGAGLASSKVDSVEQQHKEMKDFMQKCKSQGGNTMDCYSQYRDTFDKQNTGNSDNTEIPAVTKTTTGGKTLDTLKQQERRLTRRNANADPEVLGGHKNNVQKTLNNISTLQGGEDPSDGHVNTELEPDKSVNVQQALPKPQISAPQPQASQPVRNTLKDPPVSQQPQQPQQDNKPSITDRFLTGVNRFGQAMDRATDRIDTFHQRSGAGNQPGSLGKTLQYGLMGQEGITQNQVKKNVYDSMISQGYTHEQAKIAADQAARESTRQQRPNISRPRASNTSQYNGTNRKSGAGSVEPPQAASGASSMNNTRVNDIVRKLQQSGFKPGDPQFKSLVDSEAGGDQQLALNVVNAMLNQQTK